MLRLNKGAVKLLIQEFMRVYDVLREELLADDLIAGQPSFSAEYMGKVDVWWHTVTHLD